MSSEYDSGYDTKGLVFTSSILVIAGILYTVYLDHQSDQVLVSIGFMGLLAGLLLEVGHVTKNWKTIWLIVLGSSAVSFPFLIVNGATIGSFIPEIQDWSFMFCLSFSIAAIVIFDKEFIPQVSESATMLQSIAIIYWLVDFGVLNIDSLTIKIILLTVLIPACYSLYHAFSYTKLKSHSRLILSIWSSIILLAFSIDNMYGVFIGGDIETADTFGEISYIFLKYFLLGVSLIYIVQNFMLLSDFIPNKTDRLNSEYLPRVKKLTKLHIERFSPTQAHRSHSLFALVFSVTVFVLNYYFEIVPRQMAIWSVFLIFPILLSLITKQKETVSS